MAYSTRSGAVRNQSPAGAGYNSTPPPLNNSPPPANNVSPHDPSNYTQPAYSTQPGFANQPNNAAAAPAPGATSPNKTLQQGGPPAKKEGQDGATPEPVQQDDANSNPDPAKRKFGPRPWYRKGYNVMRVSKKIRKRRQNAKLRHILTPKNAMMVLHELHPELKIVATEQLNAANQMVYTVDIEIEGKTYRGHGMSKLAAKQAGCENALKAVLLDKMAKSNIKVNHEGDNVSIKSEDVSISEVETSEAAPGAAAAAPQGDAPQSMDTSEQASGEESAESEKVKGNKRFAEDDVPWGSLASFALYKLFSEWQSQGYQLPATPSSIPTPVFQKMPSFTMAPMKKIPDDANKKHPVQLLNQLRPGSQYSETREGTPPNLSFTFTVVVDGQTYQGVGSSKKDAKKECARAALEAMGVKYD